MLGTAVKREGICVKNMKMVYKLFLVGLLIGIIPIIGVGVLSYISAATELETSVVKTNHVYATLAKSKISSFMDERLGDGMVIANAPGVGRWVMELTQDDLTDSARAESEGRMGDYLTLTLEAYGYTDIFITDQTGKVVFTTTYKEELKEVDLSISGYVQGAMAGEQTWSELSYSSFVDENVMVLGTPIYQEGSEDVVIGTLNLLFDQTMINALIHTGVEQLGGSGDAYLVNADGLLMTETRLGDYSEEAALVESIDTYGTRLLSEEIKKGNTDDTYAEHYEDYRGKPVYGSLSVINFGAGYAGLIIEIDEAEAFAGTSQLRQILISTLAVTLIIMMWFLFYVAKSIAAPLLSTVEMTDRIAAYDLSQQVPQKYLTRKDEIGSIVKGIHKLQTNLTDLLSKVSSTSDQVAASAEQLNVTSAQSSTSAEEVVQTINEIANGASEQASSAGNGASGLTELGELIANNDGYIHGLDNTTTTVGSLVNEGLKIVDDLSVKTKASGEASEVVFASIRKTNESSIKIGEASNLIASFGVIQPKTAGPNRTPTISSPMTVGSPSGRRVTATSQILASSISRSRATSCMT